MGSGKQMEEFRNLNDGYKGDNLPKDKVEVFEKEYDEYIDTIRSVKEEKDKKIKETAQSSERILEKIKETILNKSKEEDNSRSKQNLNVIILCVMSVLFGVSASISPMVIMFLIPLYLRYLALEISTISK
jgi:uncharacterized membrane protein